MAVISKYGGIRPSFPSPVSSICVEISYVGVPGWSFLATSGVVNAWVVRELRVGKGASWGWLIALASSDCVGYGAQGGALGMVCAGWDDVGRFV